MHGASVIIPCGRLDARSMECIDGICRSVSRLRAPKELILALDHFPEKVAGASNGLDRLVVRYPFVRVVKNTSLQGMRVTRMLAIHESNHPILLFTDDDCFVEEDWAERMYNAIVSQGVVTGPIQSVPRDDVYSRLEGLIDQYRATAKTSAGGLKFVSFANFGIRKDLLPRIPFDRVPGIYGNDMDLGCRIRVKGTPIHIDEHLVVRTEYPKTLAGVLRRKLVHAKGIAYVQRRMGPKRWESLEIGTHGEIVRRWIGISLSAPVSFREKMLFLLMNMTYCFGLIFHFRFTYRMLAEIDPQEI